mgnify:CR=1 FL=1
MRRAALLAVLLCALIAAPWIAGASSAGEPPAPRDLPGGWPDGLLSARWLAPYVRHVATRVGEKTSSRVTWYARDGSVRREVEGHASVEFVTVTKQKGIAVHGTLAEWQVALPAPTPGEQSYLHAAGPNVLVHEVSTDAGRLRASVYVDGVLAKTLGPFLRYQGSTVQANEDGSLAVLVRPAPSIPTPRLAAFSSAGHPRFTTDLSCHGGIVAVAPGGSGVLFETNDESLLPSQWRWATKEGVRRVPEVGPNPVVLAWVPDTASAVVASSIGTSVTYRLVDFEAGAVRWTAQDPAAKAAFRGPESVVVEGGHVLLAGIECRVVEGIGHWLRSVYALDVATGTLAAAWRSNYRGPPGYDDLRFARLAEKLYVLSDQVFAPLPLDEMAARTNGWREGDE